MSPRQKQTKKKPSAKNTSSDESRGVSIEEYVNQQAEQRGYVLRNTTRKDLMQCETKEEVDRMFDDMQAVAGRFKMQTFSVTLPIAEADPNEYMGAMHFEYRTDNRERELLRQFFSGITEANMWNPTGRRAGSAGVIRMILEQISSQFDTMP